MGVANLNYFATESRSREVKALGPRFEVTVRLSSLVAGADRVWARTPGFWQGIGIAIVCMTLAEGLSPVC